MRGDVNQSVDREKRLDEAVTAYLEAEEAGQAPDRAQYLERYPDLAGELAEFLVGQTYVHRGTHTFRAALSEGSLTPRPDADGSPQDVPLEKQNSRDPGPGPGPPAPSPVPAYLGRYRVTSQLGAGGFGVVYRGYDDELQRDVA